MASRNIPKSFIIAVIAILSALYGAGFFVPLRGDWADRVVSYVLSRKLGAKVNCAGVEITRWSEVSFDKMSVSIQPAKEAFFSGHGQINFSSAPFFVFRLTDVRPATTLISARMLAFLPIAKSFQGELVIDRLSAGFLRERSGGFLHLFECVSNDFDLKGGIKWTRAHIEKAHFQLSVSPEKSKKLPKELLRRMIGKENGWSAVRIIYSQNKLILMGHRDPLFQAKWET